MSEFNKVIAELADLEAFERWRAGLADASPTPSPRTARHRATVRTEMLHASVLTAVTAGMASNFERHPSPDLDLAALATYLPSHTRLFRRSLESLVAEMAPEAQATALQCYLARIDLALRLTQAFCERAAKDRRAAFGDIEMIADCWRRTAAEAANTITIFRDEARLGEGETAETETGRVVALLRLAEAGHSPCLSADGRVTIPGWAERRRAARRVVALHAVVVVAGEAVFPDAMVRDVSATGFGIDCRCEISEGTPVTIKVAGDRQFHGCVAWCSGARLGIELDERLPADDPLLQTN